MKNISSPLILIILFLSGLSMLSSQPWMKQFEGVNNYNFYEVQKAFNDYWNDKDTSARGIGWKQFKRWEWFWEQRVAPSGEFPEPMQLYEETKRSNVFFNKSKKDRIQSYSWSNLGPSQSSGGYSGLGRLNIVRVNPNDNNVIWVGAASGGLWKSTNGGGSWSSNTDSWPALGVTDIVINPANTNIMYIATGDRDHSDTYSVGVLKSTDGGSSWNTTSLNWTTSQARTISRLLMHPNDVNILYAASTSGVYKTADAGANWTLAYAGSYKDMEFKPGTPSTIYAANNQVYRSTDDGANWEMINTNFPASSTVQRIALGVAPSNPDYIYALASNTSSAFKGLYRSTNSGDSWQEMSTSPNILGWQTTGGSGGQGWYDLCIAVSQTNENTVYCGGINTWKSTNGGANWQIISMWYNVGGIPTIHADQHDLWFVPGTNTLYSGNDGGIYRTTNGGSSWDWLGSGLKITQFYRLGTSKTNGSTVIAGAQDNGTKMLKSGSWSDVLGGDGMECLIDYTNESYVYGSIYNGDLYRSSNGGASFSSIKNNINESGAWITPYVIHPTNSSTLFSGYKNVWKTTNRGSSWTRLSDFNDTRLLTIVQVAPSNPNIIYASTGARLYRSDDGGNIWSQVNMPFGNSMTYLTVHSNNPLKIWATASGYTSNTKVYVSGDGGNSWSNYSGNLPNVPANTIVYQPDSPERVFVGTDIGVFYRDTTVGDWQDYNNGLPNVVIDELELNNCDNKIWAATYGRGGWVADLMDALQPPSANIPANHSKGNEVNNLILRWDSSAVDRYLLQVSESPSFTVLLVDEDSLSASSFLLNNLEYNKKYYWRLKTETGCIRSGWSEVYDFTTKISAPLLSFYPDKSKGQPISGVLRWSAVSGAVNYRIQISKNVGFSPLVYDVPNITGTSYSYTNLEYYTKYYWRVYASNDGGPSDWSDVWEFTTNLAPPNLKEPLDMAKGVKTQGQLKWFASSGADFYNVQIAEDEQFNNITLDTINVSVLFAPYLNLKNNKPYYWRVNAENADGTSNWSEVWQFNTIIAAPVLISPVNSSKGVPVNDTCKWLLAEGAQSYRLQISEDSSFNEIILDKASILLTEQNFVNLKNGSKYYWRVNAANVSGTSDWSSVWSFKTQLSGPTLVSPLDNQEDIVANINLVWIKLIAATKYEIQVSELSDFSKFFKQQGNITDSLFNLTNLLNDNIYYWRARGYDVNAPGEWSAVWKFITELTVPRLSNPIDKTQRIKAAGNLKWHPLQNAKSYRVQLSLNKDFVAITNLDTTNVKDTSISYANLQNARIYYWRVNAQTNQGTTHWSDVWSFRIELTKPLLIYPLDNSFEVPVDSFFVWSKVDSAENYSVELSEQEDFTNVILNVSNVADTNQSYADLKHDTKYFWRVKEKAINTEGEWTEPAGFYTILATPQQIAPPLISDSVNYNDVNILWNSVSGAETYHLMLSKEPDFSSVIIDELTLSDTTYKSEPLEPSTKYYWHIKAANVRGKSRWSDVWQFTTVTISDVNYGKEEGRLKREDLIVYPSPTSGEINILFPDIFTGYSTIEVFNQIGENVLSRQSFYAKSSLDRSSVTSRQLRIKLNDNESGVYFIKLTNGVKIKTTKFEIIR